MLFSLLLEMLLGQKVEKIDQHINFKSLFSGGILILYGSATCLPATENCSFSSSAAWRPLRCVSPQAPANAPLSFKATTDEQQKLVHFGASKGNRKLVLCFDSKCVLSLVNNFFYNDSFVRIWKKFLNIDGCICVLCLVQWLVWSGLEYRWLHLSSLSGLTCRCRSKGSQRAATPRQRLEKEKRRKTIQLNQDSPPLSWLLWRGSMPEDA